MASISCRCLTFALLTASVRAARIGLHSAAEQGQLEPLKVAINGRWDPYNEVQKKPDINGQNKKGRVALHLAACNARGDIEIVKLLLGKGADANARNATGHTALMTVAGGCDTQLEGGRPRYVAVAKWLTKHGASVDLVGPDDGRTALHIAASSGVALQLLEYIAERSAWVDAPDTTGATALHFAVRAGHAREAHALLQAGADPDVADAAGLRASDALTGKKDSTSDRMRNDLLSAASIHSKHLEAQNRAKAEKAAAKAAANNQVSGSAKAEL